MAGGYIKLHRSMLDWEWYDDINVKVLWLHLLFMAHYKPYKWRGRTIFPGQVVTGLEKLHQQTKLTVQEVRTVLCKLEATGEITVESTNKGSIVTIENWAKYQESDDEPTGQATGQATSHQQEINKPLTNEQQLLKNLKNLKKERKEEVGDDKSRLVQLFTENHGIAHATPAAASGICDWVDIIGSEVVEQAILITAKNNGKRPWGYIEPKLREWNEQGIRTKTDVEAYTTRQKPGQASGNTLGTKRTPGMEMLEKLTGGRV